MYFIELAYYFSGFTDSGDVDPDSIVVSNPFKETWVTSPLTKFGRLVKTGNQATGILLCTHYAHTMHTLVLETVIINIPYRAFLKSYILCVRWRL